MKLALARDGESCQLLGILVQLHLPETGSEVQSRENCRVGPANVADTFGDFFH